MPLDRDHYEIEEMLYGEDNHFSAKLLYRDDYHPTNVVEWFAERYNKINDPERFESEHRLMYVQNPVRPPTIVGYAAAIRLGRSAIYDWISKYPEFANAIDVCQAMQEAAIIELTALGAYNPGFAALIMKNLNGWQDKIEQTHKGAITLNFDQQDEEA